MEAIENANSKNLISLLPVTFKFPPIYDSQG